MHTSAPTGQGSKEATDFLFNWLLTLIGTGCLVLERISAIHKNRVTYFFDSLKMS